MGEPDWYCLKCGAYHGDDKLVMCECGGAIQFAEPSLVGLDEDDTPIVELEPLDEEE